MLLHRPRGVRNLTGARKHDVRSVETCRDDRRQDQHAKVPGCSPSIECGDREPPAPQCCESRDEGQGGEVRRAERLHHQGSAQSQPPEVATTCEHLHRGQQDERQVHRREGLDVRQGGELVRREGEERACHECRVGAA